MSADRASLPSLPRRWLHRLYEYFALWFGLALLGAISLTWTLLAVPLYYVLPKRWAVPLGRWASTTGFRIYLGALSLIGACRFDLSALDSLRDEGPMIVAPNHPCLLDALMVISRLPNMACIMKVDIVDNVFLGAGARLAGYIRNDAQLSMIRQSVAELKNGSQLLIFPEGTRTTRWPVNICKGTAALIASRARVPIQTVFIETDSAYLGKGWPLFRRPPMPITYRIRLGRRFDPPEKAGVFTEELERYFIDELRDAPHFLPPDAPQATESGTARQT
ncbi:lysophospholipid acyltransferase family protein [Thiobacillus denitrificans]|uniref:lysophospholipid acyltransferase family protein n=1 Tax=Thiobacillus denitrificans TaxID=36861 RepID=UPI000A940591|nr:lysophospholipid acyltransferase family protein [Thiobacillus denitrificans]